MASSVEERLEKNLECGICLESFQEPKVLRCQHTYCRKCLERIIFRATGERMQKITCPECRMETKLQRGCVANLPSNFLLKQLLEVNNDAQLSTQVNCEKHPEEPVDLYCDCGEPICRACTVIYHRSHSNQPLKTVFALEKKKIATLLKQAKPQVSALKAEIASIEGIEEEFQQNCLDVNELIDSVINAKIAQLETAREGLKRDVGEISASKIGSLKKRRDALILLVSRVENVKDIVTDCSRSGEKKVEFLRKRSQFVKHLNDLRSTSHDIRPCEKVTIQLKRIHPLAIYPNAWGDLRNQGTITVNERGKPVQPSLFEVLNNWTMFALIIFMVGLTVGSFGQKK